MMTNSSLALILHSPATFYNILSIGWNQMGAGPGLLNPSVDTSILNGFVVHIL